MTAVDSSLERAARLDQSGDHDGAVNVLAKATGAGSLPAMTTLGKRLLVGDRAPYLPKDGAGMVLEAAQKGNAEAMATVAVMQCIGVFQQKNWQQALATLTMSAKLGWNPAREQLLLLSGLALDEIPGQLEITDEKYWDQKKGDVELDYWMREEVGVQVNDSPLIMSFPDFLPVEVCKLLIRQSASRLQPALVYDPQGKRNIRNETRTNSIAQYNLVENDLVHFLMQERMSACCNQPMVHMEATSILNYKPGEQITNHYDFVDPDAVNYKQEIAANGQRVITFLIYLNDDYTGGETCFPKLDVDHKGKRGEGLYFVNSLDDGSADVRTLHAGKPPLVGEKWIVSQFVRNLPVKYTL